MVWHSLQQRLQGLLYDDTIEDEHYRKLRQKSSSSSAIFVGMMAAVGGFLYGYDTGLINDIMEMQYVKTEIPANHQYFTVHERALVTAILSLGTFVGALIAPLISDSYGRKFSIILSAAVIFNVGNTLQIAATDVALICSGRAISGLSVGILSAIVPLYQAEASPKWVRGSIVFTYQWAITWGLLIASAICQGTRRMTTSGSYRIPIGVQYLWSLILCVGMFYLPESPRFYVQKNNIHAALESLHKLRRLPIDDDDLVEELVEIKANYDYEMSFGKTVYLDCFRSGGGRHKQGLRMLTGIGVQAFQQCSGINFIFYYGVNFFSSTGISQYYLMSFITYLVNVIFTVPGIIFIDVIGRRKLLLIGGVGMAVSNFLIAIIGVSMTSPETKGITCIVFSCSFIACFASSWGGCAWAICSDIYGISIRQKAVSITAATNWLINFVFAYITPYLIDTGSHTAALGTKIFFVWGGCNSLGVLFVYIMVYETKGLKLEEVDLMYQECPNSRSSTKFKSRRLNFSAFTNEGGIQSLVHTPPNEWNLAYLSTEKNPSNTSSSPGATEEPIAMGYMHNDEPLVVSAPTSSSDSREPAGNAIPPHTLMPVVSNTSEESTQSVGSGTDYQKYLKSLHGNDTDNSRNPSTSFTSNSFIRGPGSVSKQGNSNIERAFSRTTQSDSVVSKNVLSDTLDLQMNETGNMKIIAVPFYDEPPSDSDTE